MITNEQLLEHLLAAHIPESEILIYDEVFECPTEEWVVKDFASQFNGFLFYNRITYNDLKFDCNKFAKLATVVADLDNLDTKESKGNIALGMFAAMGHCVNIVDHNGKICFYEPQPSIPEGRESTIALVTMVPVAFTREEIQTCVGCIFV